MHGTWRAIIGYACLTIAASGGFVSEAQGGPILDWLFGRRPDDQVVTYYLPGTAMPAYVPQVAYQAPAGTAAYYAPSAAYAAGAPTTVYRVTPGPAYQPQPTTAYAAPPVAGPVTYAGYPAPTGGTCCPPTGVAAAPIVGGTPATSYRTVWRQVPVTAFRPVTTTDPVTGYPVTVMSPCTTYTWEAERRSCGFFGRLFGMCDPPPAQAAAVTTAYPVAPGWSTPPTAVSPVAPISPVAPASPVSPVGGFLPGQPVAPPYAAPGPTLVPSANSPGGMPPTNLTPGSSGGLAPIQSVPGGEPADVQPSLKLSNPPSTLQRIDPGQPPAESSAGAPAPADASNSSQPVPLPALGAPANGRSSQSPPKPVPDPDATPVSPQQHAAPSLLNPRDQTATLTARHAWAHVTIAWPGEQDAGRRTVRTRPVSPAPPATEPWDETGWRTIGK